MCRFHQLLWLRFSRLDSGRCTETWFYPLIFLRSHIYYIILSLSIEFEFPLLFTMTVNMFSLVIFTNSLLLNFSVFYRHLRETEGYFETNYANSWALVAMSRIKIFSIFMKINVFLKHSYSDNSSFYKYWWMNQSRIAVVLLSMFTPPSDLILSLSMSALILFIHKALLFIF
jgi:hypothetical protein